jgi:hypothetical protein
MKQFMPDVSAKERTMMLQENSVKVENTSYQRELNDDELTDRRENLSENCIVIDSEEDEFRNYKETYKAKMAPLKIRKKVLLSEIKNRQAGFQGIVYQMADHENGIMELYDADGRLINSRKLRPEERQAHLFPLKKVINE